MRLAGCCSFLSLSLSLPAASWIVSSFDLPLLSGGSAVEAYSYTPTRSLNRNDFLSSSSPRGSCCFGRAPVYLLTVYFCAFAAFSPNHHYAQLFY